jgi:ribosome recycling factor
MSDMIKEIIDDLDQGFRRTLDGYKKDLTKMRTGRANVAILDGIKVIYYGSPTPLNQVAAVNAPDPRLITIKPYDKALLAAIEKAVISADIGITPSNDGEIIRLPVPPLSGERRKELVKLARKQGEEAKVAMRNQRRDANAMVKDLESEGVPEDDVERALKKVQDMTDQCIKLVDEAADKKEKEILEG